MHEPSNLRVVNALDEGDERFDVRAPEVLRALAEAEDRHFWHASRNRFIGERLTGLGVRPGARVLELGCGGGCVAAHLAREGYDVVGVDGHASLARLAAVRAPSARFIALDLAGGTDAGTIGGRDFDVVALFDVLEHLDDPAAALAGAVRMCRPGGLVVGTVPALMALWSRVDEVAGHRLRYSRAQLEALCSSVQDARIVEIADFNRVLVPLMWLQRRSIRAREASAVSEANLSVPRAPVNRALFWLVRAEHRASRLFDRTPLRGASLWFALERDS